MRSRVLGSGQLAHTYRPGHLHYYSLRPDTRRAACGPGGAFQGELWARCGRVYHLLARGTIFDNIDLGVGVQGEATVAHTYLAGRTVRLSVRRTP